MELSLARRLVLGQPSRYMKVLQLRLTRFGRSHGVRLPVSLLKKYGFPRTILVEERAGKVVLRLRKETKLSWEETAKQMAAAQEDWSDMEPTAADGIEPTQTPHE